MQRFDAFSFRSIHVSLLLATIALAGCNEPDTPVSRRAAIPGGELLASPDRLAADELSRPDRQTPTRSARERPAMPSLFGSLWRSVGPAGIRDGQAENAAPANKVSGAVHVLVPHPADRNRLWIGTSNGGVWETRNARATNPSWRPLTDELSSSSIGALDLDPTDGSRRTLLGGYGNVSSYGASGIIGRLIYSRDGGDQWREIEDPLLTDRHVVGVAARGNVLIAATASLGGPAIGGVNRSTDRGATWAPVTGIPITDAFDLTADPANPARLYAATVGAIYRSNDSGATWTDISSSDPRLATLLADPQISLAEVDVGAQGRLFLIITRFGNGEYIGYTDGGAWTEMDLPYTPESPFAAVDAVLGDGLYGVELSSPGHNLFIGAQVEVTGLTSVGVADGVYIVVTFDPDTFMLYTAFSNSGAYDGAGQWRVVNGTNPKAKSNGQPSPFGGVRRPGGQGFIHLSIAGDPYDRNLVYVGGDRQDLIFDPDGNVLNFLGAQDYSGRLFRGDTRVARSRGVLSLQWAHLTHRDDIAEWPAGGTASTSAPHADSRDLEFDAAGDLLEGDDGGVFRRTRPRDNRGDWFSLAGNLQLTELHNIAYDRVSRTVIGGAQDNGTPMRSPGSMTWDAFTTGDGADVSVDDVTLAAQGRSIRYTGYPGAAAVFRSYWDAAGTNVGVEFPAWQPLDGQQVFGSFTTPVELNSVDPRRILVGGSNVVVESLDQGETTTAVGPGIQAFQHPMAYGGFRNGQANPDVLYYGRFNEVLRRGHAGEVATPTPTPFPGTLVRDLAMAPRDHDTLYALDSSRVFVTRDAGITWRELTGNLVDPSLRSVVVVQVIPTVQAVVVGGLDGVAVTWLFGNQVPATPVWFRLGTNLPRAPVWDLDWDAVDRVLTVATLGRGAWQARFTD